MATKRNLEALDARRVKGARMLKRGVAQAEVARRLGVSRQSVNRWAQLLEQANGAVNQLKGRGLGRPRRLDAAQCAWLSRALLGGALEAGFPTELGTVKRVRALIKRELGVEYSNTGCWELLGNLGFSPQKPEKRALQRDEQAISTWKRKGWPALKKSPNARGEP